MPSCFEWVDWEPYDPEGQPLHVPVLVLTNIDSTNGRGTTSAQLGNHSRNKNKKTHTNFVSLTITSHHGTFTQHGRQTNCIQQHFIGDSSYLVDWAIIDGIDSLAPFERVSRPLSDPLLHSRQFRNRTDTTKSSLSAIIPSSDVRCWIEFFSYGKTSGSFYCSSILWKKAGPTLFAKYFVLAGPISEYSTPCTTHDKNGQIHCTS